MKIRVQQLNQTIGDIDGNRDRIIRSLIKASDAGIDLLILPELVVCGYPPMDLLERSYFREYVYAVNEDIIGKSGATAILFGTITPNLSQAGRKVFNSAILAHKGKKIAEVHKTLLPTYDVFDEFRYFEPNTNWQPVEYMGLKFGITICEDVWNTENEIVYHIYDRNPARVLHEAGARILVNISASPFTKQKPELRLHMLQEHCRELGMPIFYANQVGANTEIIFDGDSMILGADGSVCERANLFEEDFIDADIDPDSLECRPVSEKKPDILSSEERLFKALVTGLRDYMDKLGFPGNVIIGLSGGIDSSLAAVIASEALGPDRVIGMTMPSRFSSGGSISDSKQLAENLGITFLTIPIKTAYDNFLGLLEPEFKNMGFNVAEENIQARIRGLLLMAMSNKFGYLVVSTGNKSEMAVGYCTLYGDMAGGLAVISDLYKSEVYDVCRWLNTSYFDREVIPVSILEKPPSAELRPDQKDSDSLPEYDILDKILKAYIEEQLSAQEIVQQGNDPVIVEKVIHMVDLNEYKRRQSAPGLRVSPKAFGVGRRMPIVQQWTDPGFNGISKKKSR